MRRFEVNGEQCTFYYWTELPWNKLRKHRIVTQNKRKACIDVVATFDIETTTIDDRPKGGKCYGFMYIWQFCIDGYCCYGRTWDEYIQFIQKLSQHYLTTDTKHLVVYVHNLSFEFQFIRNFFEWDNIFAKDRREVLKAVDTNGIEYRCSYYLSNMSLAKFCENTPTCVHYKQDGDDYNYSKTRTPKTILSNKQLAYCYCDVKGLAECIEYKLKDDTLATIPLTSTGYIRRMCRQAMKKNPKNRQLFKKTRLTKEDFDIMQQARRGGNTLANRAVAGHVLYNVESADATSSYPFQMLTKYYPVSNFTKISNITWDNIEQYTTKYCCLFKVTIENCMIKPNITTPYLAYSKAIKKMGKEDIVFNGRLLYSPACRFAFTELDWEIFLKQYTFDRIAISDFRIATRGELPEELKDVIRKLYYDKTTLKKSDPYLYAKQKNLLNSIFGMTCTNPVHDIFYLNEDNTWTREQEDIEEGLEKFYKSRNSFLPPQWGVWVMAHGRHWLQEIFECSGINTAYGDTDSDKYLDIDREKLEKVNQKAIELSEKNKAYADYKGKRYHMGVFDSEGTYSRFITWGSKKYAYEQDHKLHITIAGVNKEQGKKWLIQKARIEAKRRGIRSHADTVGIALELFKTGFVFSEHNGGGLEAHWNDEHIHYITVNGERIKTASNVGLIDSTYTLGITQEFQENMYYGIDI